MPKSMLNDAVLTHWAGDLTLHQVIAVTNDGRGVVCFCNKHYLVESKEGGWECIGKFERRGWFFKHWVFVPNQKAIL